MGYLGCHLSSAGGYAAMCKTAAAIGADTFQFFTRNPRGGKAKALDPADAAVLAGEMAAGRLGPVIAHAPYTINPCSQDPRVREFALNTMADDPPSSPLPVPIPSVQPRYSDRLNPCLRICGQGKLQTVRRCVIHITNNLALMMHIGQSKDGWAPYKNN